MVIKILPVAGVCMLFFLSSCGCDPGEVKVGINGGSVCRPESDAGSSYLLPWILLLGVVAVYAGFRSK